MLLSSHELRLSSLPAASIIGCILSLESNGSVHLPLHLLREAEKPPRFNLFDVLKFPSSESMMTVEECHIYRQACIHHMKKYARLKCCQCTMQQWEEALFVFPLVEVFGR